MGVGGDIRVDPPAEGDDIAAQRPVAVIGPHARLGGDAPRDRYGEVGVVFHGAPRSVLPQRLGHERVRVLASVSASFRD
jgi:hypothetical protein